MHSWPGHVLPAPSFWSCLAEPAPANHSFAITPVGCSTFGGDAQLAGGSWLCASSWPRGFPGTGRAVSVASSFASNPTTTNLVPFLHLRRKLEGPVSSAGHDSSPSSFPALGFLGSRRAAAGQGGFSHAGAAPSQCSHCACALHSTAQAPLELLGSPEETPSQLVPHQPWDVPQPTTHPH